MSVYFITAREAGTVKIGNSLEPHGRLRELQTSCPHKLKLEAMIPGAFAEEGDLHWRFSEARIQGEWFALTPEIEELIASNPAKPKPVTAKEAKTPKERRGGPWRRLELPREREARIAAEERAAAEEIGRKWLSNLEAAGEINFPFRAKENA